MTEETAPDPSGHAEAEAEPHPKGTLLLGGLFVLLMAAMWIFAYFTMIVRS